MNASCANKKTGKNDTQMVSVVWASQVVLLRKHPPANARDTGSVPGLGRSPGEGNSSPYQYSCLENSMDRGAWPAIFHEVAKSQTQLNNLYTHTHTHTHTHSRDQAVWSKS